MIICAKCGAVRYLRNRLEQRSNVFGGNTVVDRQQQDTNKGDMMKTQDLRYEELDLADLDVVVGGAGRTLTPPPNPLGLSNEGALAGRDAFAADAAAHGGSAGVYLGLGSNVAGNGPSTVMTLGTDGVHFYDSNATGVGNGASASGMAGVWAANSPNGSDYWTGPGTAGSVGLKEGGAASVDFGYNSSGVSAGISLGAGASVGGVAVSESSTFGTEVHPFGDTSQAAAPPGSLADQAGFNDIGSHSDAPGSLADQAGINDIGSHSDAPGSLADQAGINDIGGHSDGGAADHGADLGAAADHGGAAVDHSGDTGGAAVDHSGDTGGAAVDHSGDTGGNAGYSGDSNFGNDYGDYGGGGGDFGGSDFG
jgi:hypothetical protein